jgi:hypothetical protein
MILHSLPRLISLSEQGSLCPPCEVVCGRVMTGMWIGEPLLLHDPYLTWNQFSIFFDHVIRYHLRLM